VITRSKYDHVALILRYTNEKVVIFESLSETGVGICEWDRFLNQKWNNMYDLVVYRKLYLTRSKIFTDTIDEFVRQSVGKKFKMNA
jgi:hypothetical protein